MFRAIDLYVNPNMSATLKDPVRAALGKGVNEFYFRTGDDFFRDIELDSFLGEMDKAGVAHAVLSFDLQNKHDWIAEFSRKHSDRFSLCPVVNPTKGMEAVWALEDLVKSERVTLARIIPFEYERPVTDAIYYPIFAKCAELDLPISIFTGIPGPRADAESQNPIYLDKICRYFPMLRIIMNHGADPWWGVAIRLMIKYPNLYMMTSAWMPKYLPDELINFMNTRGQNKIMWASDHPVLNMRRCLAGVDDIAHKFRPGVLEKYLYENAAKVVLSPRHPRR